ncbi:MAG: hypothetical protein H6843_14045 [Rhodospirillaceae bacterium]|nr:hypothetical protein [Rhodospirillaceae bacterium]
MDRQDLKNTGEGGQLGFDMLLSTAMAENEARRFERETAHLPDTLEEAVPFFRGLIERHHAAMMAADVDETMRLRNEADLLAQRVNGGDRAILADENAPGRVLERETAATPGDVPLWGQTGNFEIPVCGARVRIELEGVFGIGTGFGYWPGFSAHAVDPAAPFVSPTGYRSFLGQYAGPVPGLTPDQFAARSVENYVADALKGCLVAIKREYHPNRGEAGEP